MSPTQARKNPLRKGDKMSGKEYAREMKKLHVELVKLQEWVKLKGLKVCIVFEGRDGAGKGGTIKAITERVSPRVFRVIALPAPTEREKSQMYIQRYLPHLPAAGEVVIFDRSWYNRAGVERVMGFCTEEQAEGFLKVVPAFEKADRQLRHHPAQVLAGGEPRGADAAARGPHRRRPQDLEALARWISSPTARWDDYSKARDDMFAGDRHCMGAVVRRAIRRQERRARLNIISHLLSKIPYKSTNAPKVTLPKRKIGRDKAVDFPFKVRAGTFLTEAPRRRLSCGGRYFPRQSGWRLPVPARRLEFQQGREAPAARDEVRRRALLHDAAVVDYDNSMRLSRRSQPVSDGQHRCATLQHRDTQRLTQCRLAGTVYKRGGLVEQKNAGL